jgi:hypothetical protein
MTNAAGLYRVRRGTESSGAYRVVKWCGDQKTAVYSVEPSGWWQKCGCLGWQYRHGVCRHIKLVNLLSTGRFKDGQAYVWDGTTWRVAGELPRTARPAVEHVQSLGGLNDGSVLD